MTRASSEGKQAKQGKVTNKRAEREKLLLYDHTHWNEEGTRCVPRTEQAITSRTFIRHVPCHHRGKCHLKFSTDPTHPNMILGARQHNDNRILSISTLERLTLLSRNAATPHMHCQCAKMSWGGDRESHRHVLICHGTKVCFMEDPHNRVGQHEPIRPQTFRGNHCTYWTELSHR